MAEKTVRVKFVMPAPMYAALTANKQRNGRTYSSVIREALAMYLGIPDTVQIGGYREKRDA